MSRFRKLVLDVTDLLDALDGGEKYSREVREDLTAQTLLECFAHGTLKWKTL